MHPTKEQIKAGRALTAITQQELAERSKLSLSTIQRIERHGVGHVRGEHIEQLIDAFFGYGIEFISADGKKGVGIRKLF